METRGSTSPVPATKLRTETSFAPPPHEQQTQDGGERRLGFLDWLIQSPTAAPDTPPPATYNFGKKDNTDDGPFRASPPDSPEQSHR
ncbi:hypothetical protein PHMEG_00022768 [Phytophthora megakarya]|uniref:Uncharacterized protein n=1 Tax=Phytophthora megakarya TaxID=4795 RepID=A0A225VJK3_9STRA|nr:hypothetical protein PHMEG_00022768 [Phytophthora megakarya]